MKFKIILPTFNFFNNVHFKLKHLKYEGAYASLGLFINF